MKKNYYLGIDVGTGSARAGLFDEHGRLAASAVHPIRMWKPAPDHVEQSSDDIWQACCRATKEALKTAGLSGGQVAGLGFDATCSLVALDAQNRPVSVSTTGKAEQNVIVWMDHRSIPQAERINRTHDPVLRYVGGVISPEMQTPKLLWLKENLPASWRRTARFFDLPDYLTYRATGDDTRSLCSTTCKWTYLGHKGNDGAGWSQSYFRKIGLADIAEASFAKIGTKIRPMGEPVGLGLCAESAKELGLNAGTPVGVSIIDAHAGGLGMLGASVGAQDFSRARLERRLALIGGTSSCHMAVSSEPRFIRGIWGPYHSAMIPGLWLTEGGQSATGALLDCIIASHAATPALQDEAKKQGMGLFQLLNAMLGQMAHKENALFPAALTRDLHVQPDFHGNRSPRADPTLRGVISGLTLSISAEDLARRYLAAIQAVAYGTRHIIEEMNRRGYRIDTIFLCGGGTKNQVFMREHADITGCRLILPREPEAVLLGSAVLGAVASGRFPDVLGAMRAMNAAGKIIEPSRGEIARFHDAKFRVFHRMHKDYLAYRKLMNV